MDKNEKEQFRLFCNYTRRKKQGKPLGRLKGAKDKSK